MAAGFAEVRSEICVHDLHDLSYEQVNVGYLKEQGGNGLAAMRSVGRWVLDGREIAEGAARALLGDRDYEFMRYFQVGNKITLDV